MLNPENEENFEERLHKDTEKLNSSRLGLIEVLTSFKPPQSTKTAVYKWYDAIRESSRKIDVSNTEYINNLQLNFEASNQKIINKLEETLVNIQTTLLNY